MNNFSLLGSIYKNTKPEEIINFFKNINQQIIKPSEILIVLDGPIKSSVRCKLRYFCNKKYKVRIICNKRNEGLGEALKLGINNCKYDLIFRTDFDDNNRYDRFYKQIKYFKKTGAQIIGSNLKIFAINKKNIRKVPEYDVKIKNMLKFRNPINHQTVAFKKKFILKIGNYEKINFFEDYYLWLKANKNNLTFYNIQDTLVSTVSNDELFKRRGGVNYFRSMVSFCKIVKKKKLIKFSYFSFFIRILIALVPNIMRIKFYENFLRKNYHSSF
jgi:glycosyltransferase involved in cell wall biosynthesis